MYSNEYVIYTTDESFDYDGPFGSQTHREKGLHGFEVSFNEDYFPILESIEGFGAFDVEFSNIKTYDEFKQKVEEVAKELDSDDEDTTSYEALEELIEDIEEAKKEKEVRCA